MEEPPAVEEKPKRKSALLKWGVIALLIAIMAFGAAASGYVFRDLAAAAGFAHPVWTSGGFNNGSLETAVLQVP